MFKLEDKVCFIKVNLDYLEKLHDVCEEVQFNRRDYENKVFMGILLTQNLKKYVIPLTSAKGKHKTCKNVAIL